MRSPDTDDNAHDELLLASHGATLLALAADSVEHGIRKKRPLSVKVGDYAAELKADRATFVTLTKSGDLRGCVGTCAAEQALVADVASNAFAAAFHDSRFAPVAAGELAELDFSISLLSHPDRLAAENEREMLALLRPGVDGLILGEGRRRAVFLPDVWRALPEPREFVANLKLKAGMERDYWSPHMRAERFTTRSICLSEHTVAVG